MIEHSDDVLAAQGPERDALVAVDSYMDAFNRCDLDGMDAALHFPHVRIASGRVQVMEGPGRAPEDFFPRFKAATGWAYSRWDYRRAVQSTADKVHFAVQFTRYRTDGSAIGSYPSIWIVTLHEDRWGVQARSSFAP